MLKIQLCISGINYILKHIHKKAAILNCNNISQYYCFNVLQLKNKDSIGAESKQRKKKAREREVESLYMSQMPAVLSLSEH